MSDKLAATVRQALADIRQGLHAEARRQAREWLPGPRSGLGGDGVRTKPGSRVLYTGASPDPTERLHDRLKSAEAAAIHALVVLRAVQLECVTAIDRAAAVPCSTPACGDAVTVSESDLTARPFCDWCTRHIHEHRAVPSDEDIRQRDDAARKRRARHG